MNNRWRDKVTSDIVQIIDWQTFEGPAENDIMSSFYINDEYIIATMKSSVQNPEVKPRSVTLYKSLNSGEIYFREDSDFFGGRFEQSEENKVSKIFQTITKAIANMEKIIEDEYDVCFKDYFDTGNLDHHHVFVDKGGKSHRICVTIKIAEL